MISNNHWLSIDGNLELKISNGLFFARNKSYKANKASFYEAMKSCEDQHYNHIVNEYETRE